MGDDNPFDIPMDLQDAEDEVRAYAAETYPLVHFPPDLFHAVLLRREGLSRAGLVAFFVPDAKSDIDAAARAPDMRAFVQQKREEGEAHVARYGGAKPKNEPEPRRERWRPTGEYAYYDARVHRTRLPSRRALRSNPLKISKL